ncbi:hypothetical protein A1Q2_06130 [Trichosporon asahii var. asahii CBS 8904]|uniref:Uncharacterized protein n=1 Tax=Trichosporon asahii var. asahii (strain CBS 8904) TaxID=1220162 RepID=K1V6G8_TRIAC|nr:hypothetical protein A1Q2_06130 [Trichosporon asahii var. asahii CBS 8904]
MFWVLNQMYRQQRELMWLYDYCKTKAEENLDVLEHEIEEQKASLRQIGPSDTYIRNAALLVQYAFTTSHTGRIPLDILAARQAIEDCIARLDSIEGPLDRASLSHYGEIQDKILEMQDMQAKLGRIHRDFAGYLHSIING